MYEDFPWVFVMDAAYKAVKDPVKIIVNILHVSICNKIQRENLLLPLFAGCLFFLPHLQEVKVDSGSEQELSWVQSALSWIQLTVAGVIWL